MTEDAPAADAQERKRLAVASLVSFLVALLLLLVAVLPAEYGVDPTGVGKALGLTRLNDPGPALPGENVTVTTAFSYQGTWGTRRTTLDPIEGYSKDGTKISVSVPLSMENVTRVTALLEWTDDNRTADQATEPDFFEVQLQAPDGRVGPAVLGRNEAGGDGRVNASLAWRAPPATQEVEAETPEEAASVLRRSVPSDASASGTWNVNVTLVLAGGNDASPVPVGGSLVDDGNAWTLTLSVETFRLETERLPTARVRHDNATITIPSGRGLEFKLRLNESQRVAYDWSTRGGSVYFDFHGQLEDAAASDYTSHKKGTSSSDRGSLTAPFTGFHGWYFENPGADDVVLELDLRGVYTVVGQV